MLSKTFRVSFTTKFLVLLGVVLSANAYSCNCNGRTYDNTEIFDAVKRGYAIDPAANPTDQSKFPRRYGLTPTDDYPWCGPGHYAEYPLLSVPPGPYDPTATPVLDPGHDRVVYLVGTRRTFCGCLTSEGQENPEQLELCLNES
ncbi:hypothetical protein D9756_008798 [Leucocoprinus leucothites]|uniref:Uncharacterized protein n=1 Tax=Leucocoprinus leucothites TaxID=201217 RepID=A0A8H5FUN6_9AGAR|nr:hypothetical protein D9756_008798 [Leucoagaricus leucothites]